MTAVSAKTREAVLDRDGFRCVSCGGHLTGPYGYSLHHRCPKGMGGTKRPESNSPANLLTLCGSGVTGCHGFVESNRELAYDWGYLVHRIDNPADVPVLTRNGWVLFDDAGGKTYRDDSRNLAEIKDALDVRLGTTTGDRA